MKVTITAGTHIGIVGCYGEKTINITAKKYKDIHDQIKSFMLDSFKQELKDMRGFRTEWSTKGNLHTFLDKNGCTLLEYYYELLPKN